MVTVWREIWENYQENNGPCSGCPNRDCSGYFIPHFVTENGNIGSTDPDIVFVGDAPRDTHPGSEDDKNRQVKNANDKAECRAQRQYDEKEPMLIDNIIGAFPDEFFKEYIDSPVKENNNGFTTDGRIRFTNAKKCGDIYPKDAHGVKNHTARYNCRNYLEKELEYLDPQIVVAMGGNALREVVAVLDLDIDLVLGSMKDTISGADRFTHYGENPHVVPTYHFSAIDRNYYHLYPDKDNDDVDKEDFWKEFGEKITTLLD
jgi:uracil-DNA glycosylase